jgi:hypothetical protein
VAVDLHQHALSDPILDDVDDEQRIATRPLMELAHQGAGDPVLGERSPVRIPAYVDRDFRRILIARSDPS